MGENRQNNGINQIALIEAKKNIISRIQSKMLINAYCKKTLTDEQIVSLQKFFKSCNKALSELEARDAAFAVSKIVNLGEQVLEVI